MGATVSVPTKRLVLRQVGGSDEDARAMALDFEGFASRSPMVIGSATRSGEMIQGGLYPVTAAAARWPVCC